MLRVLLVCSHGGHFTEMEQIRDAFLDHQTRWATYFSRTTMHLEEAYFVTHFGDTKFKLTLTMIHATIVAAYALLRFKPHVLVSTGSEIAIPFFYIGRLLGCYTIFIESLTRATHGSGSGRLIHPIANRFLVQWPTLKAFYRNERVEYWGAVL